ncbi:ketoacyl-ACP synthase III [Candidatus Methylomicrobium oryzae]|jgi:3-oxoacyl-[acyl-carrier-protein] synthase-3|uniref:ketoacyl-ACP synthase III n=1 Tax=Candidatus Methylomicrobium oryzae TaxID=2802053 RepID=UPI001921F3EB|nr:ketoacyl-ACP synthase III [Methylomicrobium sp. RS1]MBL1263699.1 ketoacyl-ACP synthase III [Methylomicrobium sp. RS1]
MIGIQAIGTYIPSGRIDNRLKTAKFEIDETFLTEKTGALRSAVKAEDEDTSDLCCKAFYDLQQKTGLQPGRIECAVVCTQNPDNRGLPHTSAIVHGKLGLPESCAVFDISLGCSGFVYGLSVIQAFMQANGFTTGVLFTADPYSKIVNPEDKNTSLLFGDGAAATLIGNDPVWTTGKFLFGSQGKEHASIRIGTPDGKLEMNGRAVFSFSATVVPKNILAMLESNRLTVEDIDLFALHQGSRYIVDTIKKKLAVEDRKAPFVAADYGNTVSSSIPLILSDPGNASCSTVVIAGFGVGLSWASTVLFKVNKGK